MAKENKNYKCPHCGCDLRKHGVYIDEYGRSLHELSFDERTGKFKDDEIIDGEVDEYVVYCHKCSGELDLDMSDLYVNGLPKIIKKVD